MFEKLGQFASLMKNLPKIREEMGKLQERVAQITAEGDAGAGMVKAVVNGRLEVQKVKLSDEVVAMNDKGHAREIRLLRLADGEAINVEAARR